MTFNSVLFKKQNKTFNFEVTVDSHAVVRSNRAQPPIPSSRSPVAAPVSPQCGNTGRKPTPPRPLHPIQISLEFTHSCVYVWFVRCSFVTVVHSSSQYAGQLCCTPRIPHTPFCSLRLSLYSPEYTSPFSTSVILSCQQCCTDGITPCVAFWDRIFSLSVIFLCFIHVV